MFRLIHITIVTCLLLVAATEPVMGQCTRTAVVVQDTILFDSMFFSKTYTPRLHVPFVHNESIASHLQQLNIFSSQSCSTRKSLFPDIVSPTVFDYNQQ